ncbi:GntR family transcriptional regulator [Brachybacterium sacelli]|uniref:DNA-binding GntR family transcriptional regulator n=1 Tax=Brachybacterium sacelli TaxID=173364 RepID=A0ABS4X3R3_9MICO|nr:GntR family transcriptional regulator [Brachybacterium sacelli]MBP2383095.1 DNA-binding GntR family transcriptional regulator [Brachybacterium sacelli]
MTQEHHAPSAADRAYRQVRERILDGEILPGTMLGESGLATQLGMSRTPVRAALSRLQDEGWIVIYPKRGALVRGLGPREVTELAQTRVLLEIAGVEQAPSADRPRIADRLEEIIAAQRSALAARDLRPYVRLLLAFHRGFVEAGGNRVQLELYDRLADRHRFALSADGEKQLERGEVGIAEHELLVQHFRAADTAKFLSALRAHVSETGSPREAD